MPQTNLKITEISLNSQNFLFIGFGLWLALITTYFGADVFVGGCLFGICFPLLIVGGCAAVQRGEQRENEFSGMNEKLAPFELRIFSPSVYVSDKLAQYVLNRAAASPSAQLQRRRLNEDARLKRQK